MNILKRGKLNTHWIFNGSLCRQCETINVSLQLFHGEV